ncbi:YpbF family protein [Evansella cellulosilytica]|uniref:DUF2663 family protein n=1 Tax=Evansella cellulosilytica (strain ATCC 21833 / DSM 2522 / FERM P-1141 / JCM 9156 / N-4) TaxID=649639 RepID=E6TYP7_EVAC2|nr:YpbF family protein [Evansella cellulosilytica]ADU30097.1 hypothetical protein Bcell_1835 [Evansella cellulosilytica DSM 2522]
MGEVKEYHEVIIKALIEAKEKEEIAEKKMMKYGSLFLTVLLAGFIYIVIKLTTGEAISSYLSFILADPIILLWIVAVFVAFYFFDARSKKYEKAEKDFDALKEDVIDRSSDIWSSNDLEMKRIAQYHELKNKYNINLYHK